MESNKKTTAYRPDFDRPVRALIVDDESGAVNTLQNMLRAYCPRVDIVGKAMSVNEAVKTAKMLLPELVFLDIEMPPLGSGFDFLKACEELSFGVIFTTAYPQYAVRAINTIQPWAYLVKPFSVSELTQATAVALEKIAQMEQSSVLAAGQQKLVVQDSRKGTIVFRADEILFCKADGSCTCFMLYQDGKPVKVISSRHLGEFENELPQQLFFRTHHSYIVNLAYIDRIERTGRNGIIHLRHTEQKVNISVSRMEPFMDRLGYF